MSSHIRRMPACVYVCVCVCACVCVCEYSILLNGCFSCVYVLCVYVRVSVEVCVYACVCAYLVLESVSVLSEVNECLGAAFHQRDDVCDACVRV